MSTIFFFYILTQQVEELKIS